MELARPRILIQMVCLAYLATLCTVFNIGGQAMRGYLQPHIHLANAQIEAAKRLANQENLLYTQLEGLLSHPLPEDFMESYEECLARGLTSASEQFFGIDFTQYPEVRYQTMNWTTENCDRLFHTPRVLNDSSGEATITYWTRATYTARQYATKALARLRRKTSLIRTWLAGGKQSHVVIENKAENSSLDDFPQRLEMPFGFEAVCHLPSPCKLAYRNSSVPTPATIDSGKITEEAKRTAATFSELDEIIGGYMSLNVLSLISFSLLEVMAILSYLIVSYHLSKQTSSWCAVPKASIPPLRSFSGLRGEESYTCGSLVIQIAVSLARFKLHSFTTSGSRFLLPFNLALFTISVIQLFTFFLVDIQVEHIRSLFGSSMELCLIMLGRDLDTPIRIVSSPEVTASSNDRPSPLGDGPTASDRSGATSKVAARFVSPATTIQEDIQAELKTIRARQGELRSSRFEIYSDSDSDTDDEIFVELGCSSLPTVVEKQGDWTFVDA
jgi:hypothetical protein